MPQAQKEEKKHEEPLALERRRIVGYAIDSEQVELKKLEPEDLEDVLSVMRKSAFEIGNAEKKEIEGIIKQGFSYGAYVDRMLVAVALAWPICFEESSKMIESCSQPNTLYVEDLAILIAYEGKGIREKLVDELEREAKQSGLSYVLAIVGENPKEEDIPSVIEERGTKSERLYLRKGYKFFKGGYGLTAYRKV